MNILILGGTGAMGIHLVKVLAAMNHHIDVTSRKTQLSEFHNVKYIQGNAHDDFFMEEVLKAKYDVIVDFMIYSTNEFKNKVDSFLNSCSQYVFLSSARVYASSDEAITENHSRLLDSDISELYRNTDEYALTKARQENILLNHKKKNWTIIRPYITYDTNRMQLCSYELEYWLGRILRGKKVLLLDEILNKKTTLTYGGDVADKIAQVIGNTKCLSEVYHITTEEYIVWDDVKKIYFDALKSHGYKAKSVVVSERKLITYSELGLIQIKYDRTYNRIFNNEKISKIANSNYTPVEEGIKICIDKYLINKKIGYVDWKLEAIQDRITKDKQKLRDIPNQKAKIKYIMYRYFPKAILALL